MKEPILNLINLNRTKEVQLIKVAVLLLCFFLITPTAHSQLSTKSKKAADLYYQADNYWVRGQFTMAFDLLKDAIKKDKDFYEAYFRLGVIDKSRGNTKSAESYLLKTLAAKQGHAGANFELGELYIQMGEYEKSIQHAQNYLNLNPGNEKRKAEAERFVESARYAIENIKMASEINPEVLPSHINQFAMQYFPVITADQEYLIYTRRLGTTLSHDEDLVVAQRDSAKIWSEPESISENINSSFNEGTCTISADGRILIFTSCYGRNGYGSCDLYISRKEGEAWSQPENLGPVVNSSAWDSQPSLSADGRTLYFISNRANGIGKRDIWVTSMDDNDVWSKPVNLGRSINTVDDEVSPFIHPNNQTLFFSSNGRKGFGGFDIYVSEKTTSTWEEPKNFGYPVNTGEDQVSLFITADGSTGYYSHENLKNPEIKGEIYSFTIPEGMRVKNKAKYVKGKVFDQNSKKPLRSQIELYDLSKEERISMVYSDSINGNYLMVLPEGSSYAFYVNKQGYLFKSMSFKFENDTTESLVIDIPLKPIERGSSTVLENIFFDFDKYELQEKSKVELQKIIDFLKANPQLQMEIAGHTDNIGSKDYNQQLSINRAKAVYNYLIKHDISATRITYRGYGQTNPIATNSTETGRQANRRIEFKIVK